MKRISPSEYMAATRILTEATENAADYYDRLLELGIPARRPDRPHAGSC